MTREQIQAALDRGDYRALSIYADECGAQGFLVLDFPEGRATK